MWAATYTLPGAADADLWAKLWGRLRKRLDRAGISAVWRVELQRRGVPHLHVIAWVPPASGEDKPWRVVTEGWLDCLPPDRRAMPGASQHAAKAVLMRDHAGKVDPVRGGGLEWLAYLCAHSSKSKVAQLGWQGKQWGIVGRVRFELVPSILKWEFTRRQRVFVQRVLRRLLRRRWSRRPARALPDLCGWSRVIDPARVIRLCEWVGGNVS